MRRCWQQIRGLPLLLLPLLVKAAAPPLKIDVPLSVVTSDLDECIPRYMKNSRVPGLSIALIRDAAVVYAKGFGVGQISASEPVTVGTAFEAASLGKPIAAYAALKLVAEGRLELDAPLNTYLADQFLPDSVHRNQVTLQRVLSHTSGLSNNMIWQSTTIHFEPGTQFSYSGVGFIYLQKVIEAVAREPFNTHVRTTVFEPLGMTSSSYAPADVPPRSMARGYFPLLGMQIPLPALGSFGAPNAASSLVSTPTDMARFAIELMKPRHASRNTIAQLLTNQVAVGDAVSWGLGIGLHEDPSGRSFWHWGDNVGFKSLIVGYPEQQIGVVIMTNGSNGLEILSDIAQCALGGGDRTYWRYVTFKSL